LVWPGQMDGPVVPNWRPLGGAAPCRATPATRHRRRRATLAGRHGGRPTRVNRFELIEKPAATYFDFMSLSYDVRTDNEIGGEVESIVYSLHVHYHVSTVNTMQSITAGKFMPC